MGQERGEEGVRVQQGVTSSAAAPGTSGQGCGPPSSGLGWASAPALAGQSPGEVCRLESRTLNPNLVVRATAVITSTR